MPRRPRNFFEGLYHLAPHASDKRFLFVDEEERNGFLEQLTQRMNGVRLLLVSSLIEA